MRWKISGNQSVGPMYIFNRFLCSGYLENPTEVIQNRLEEESAARFKKNVRLVF